MKEEISSVSVLDLTPIPDTDSVSQIKLIADLNVRESDQMAAYRALGL